VYKRQIQKFIVSPGKDWLEYEWVNASDDLEDEEYSCPECGETLFTNEKDALNFLKGNHKTLYN